MKKGWDQVSAYDICMTEMFCPIGVHRRLLGAQGARRAPRQRNLANRSRFRESERPPRAERHALSPGWVVGRGSADVMSPLRGLVC